MEVCARWSRQSVSILACCSGSLTGQSKDEVVVVGGAGVAAEAEEEQGAVVFGRPAEFLGER